MFEAAAIQLHAHSSGKISNSRQQLLQEDISAVKQRLTSAPPRHAARSLFHKAAEPTTITQQQPASI